MVSFKKILLFVFYCVHCFLILQMISLTPFVTALATKEPSLATGRGGGMSNPSIGLASEPGDSHWFDEPPVLGADPILSSENEAVNIDNPMPTKNVDGRHGNFWDYWQKKQGDTSYGLRGPASKRSQYLPFLTLRESFGLGKVLSHRKIHFPVNQIDDDLPDTKPPPSKQVSGSGPAENK
jgi:hypothetical protein